MLMFIFYTLHGQILLQLLGNQIKTTKTSKFAVLKLNLSENNYGFQNDDVIQEFSYGNHDMLFSRNDRMHMFMTMSQSNFEQFRAFYSYPRYEDIDTRLLTAICHTNFLMDM